MITQLHTSFHDSTTYNLALSRKKMSRATVCKISHIFRNLSGHPVQKKMQICPSIFFRMGKQQPIQTQTFKTLSSTNRDIMQLAPSLASSVGPTAAGWPGGWLTPHDAARRVEGQRWAAAMPQAGGGRAGTSGRPTDGGVGRGGTPGTGHLGRGRRVACGGLPPESWRGGWRFAKGSLQ